MKTVEEVNFWRPSPDTPFKALRPNELLLFKLHAPDNFVAGGGFFTRFLVRARAISISVARKSDTI